MNLPTKGSGTVALPTEFPTTSPGSPVFPNQPPAFTDPGAAAELLFNTMVIYGPTGSRKTSQIGEFAKYIYEKTGKKTRLLSADGGGWGPIQDLINAGIIEAWRVVEEKDPKAAIIAASQGAWPKELKNGLRVMGTPVATPSPIQRKEFLKDVAGYAVEGWTSIAALVMGDTVSKGQKISQDIVGRFEEQTEFGNMTFGAPSMSHYGFAQRFILDIIRNFSGLPMERVLYTALEGKGEDKLSKITQYGPATAGGAQTAAIPQYVGDCLHFEDFIKDLGPDPLNPKQKLVEPGVRAWFVQHPDPATGIMWPAKARLVPSQAAKFRELMGKYGYFELTDSVGLGTYLRTQDSLLASSSNAAREWKQQIDAMKKEKEKENK